MNWPVRTTSAPFGCETAFAALDGMLDQLRRAEVPEGVIDVMEPCSARPALSDCAGTFWNCFASVDM